MAEWHPEAPASAQQLSLDLYRMLKTKNKFQLNQWLADVSQSELVELQRVATGMEADVTAVHEAISSRWSNNVVEGHVNRLKMLKRQMYGRERFELLRRRVISPLAGKSPPKLRKTQFCNVGNSGLLSYHSWVYT